MKRNLHIRNFLFFKPWLAVACLRVWVLKISLLCLVTSPGHAQDVLWGLTSSQGPGGAGTVFSIQSTGADYSLHKSFVSPPANPHGSLVLGTDGNYYGLTTNGGISGSGTVFKISAKGMGFSVLKNFDYATDGAHPHGSLVLATDGNFYGMTSQGGSSDNGTVFKISAKGTGFSVLKSFDSSTDGRNPWGNLVQGRDGNFYGMTSHGSTSDNGTVFKISATGMSFSVLKIFGSTDGGNPYGSLVQGRDGNFYGMTQFGGSLGHGTVFKINADGTGFSLLKSFDHATTGGNPLGSLVQGSDGNFYGMTNQGGSLGYGTVFKIGADGTGFSVLKSFNFFSDGAYPHGNLVQGTDGDFYGMTSFSSGGYGTVFKIGADGTGFSVLKNFDYFSDGGYPLGSLVQGSNGNFYGMTSHGGSSDNGTVFKISADGTGFSVLKSFEFSTDGGYPHGNLVQGTDSDFYGMTESGGSSGSGTVFKISADGTGFLVLKSFNSSTDGSYLFGSLVQGIDGNFYGMASQGGSSGSGTVFKISADGTGFLVLKNFNSSTDGANPQGSLVIQQNSAARMAYQVKKTAGSARLKVYPNPFHYKTTVAFSFEQDQDYTVAVYDLKGSLVQRLQAGKAKAGHLVQVTWESEKSVRGVYIIRLTTQNGVQHMRTILK